MILKYSKLFEINIAPFIVLTVTGYIKADIYLDFILQVLNKIVKIKRF
jgi:hypothetical protein